MPKKHKLTPDEKLLISFGRRAYLELRRVDEMAVEAIEEMVERGDTPARIQAFIITHFPHKWIESQQVKAVAEYLKQGNVIE